MIEYFSLDVGDQLPELSRYSPYRCLILTAGGETKEWRSYMSDQLVNTDCLYMMAWGRDCSLWDDWIDETVIERYIVDQGLGHVPDDKHIMTTWHRSETLAEMIYFAKFQSLTAMDGRCIDNLIIFDIGFGDRRDQILQLYDVISL